jgi:type III secretion system YscQ/HrcQ family protein
MLETVPQATGLFAAGPAPYVPPCAPPHAAGNAAALRLPQIEPQVQQMSNQLFGRAALSELALPGQVLTWRWHPAPLPDSPALTLLCAAGDVRCALSFEADDGPGLDESIDLEAFAGPALLAAAAVRYAAVLAHLDRISGRRFECIDLRRGACRLDAQALALGFVLGDAAQAPRALNGVLQVLPWQAAFWSALQGHAAALPASAARLPVAVQVGLAQRLTVRVAALRRLRVGGALLLGSVQAEGLCCRLQWASGLPAWSAVLNGTALCPRAPAATTTEAFAEMNWSATMDSMPATSDDEQTSASAAIDAMPVVLDFHLGEVSVPLSALSAALAPGYVIELDRPLDTSTVSVRANGQLLAQGELIQVGDQLAVRISRIVSSVSSVSSASSANNDGSV